MRHHVPRHIDTANRHFYPAAYAACLGRCRAISPMVRSHIHAGGARWSGDEEQFLCRQRPDLFLIVLWGDQRGGVRLVQIAAQLGEYLVEAYAHGNGDAQLLAGAVAQLGCNLHARARMIAYIQPAFIQTERLHLAGILGVHGAHAAGIVYVFFAVWRQKNQIGALFKRAANGFARAHATFLGWVALS